MEAGIVLRGSEVKSLREGKAQMTDAYAVVERGEVWLRDLHIPPYEPASRENHEPERPRKLLLHRGEIERLIGKTAAERPDPDPDCASTSRGRGRRSSWRWRVARRGATGGVRSRTVTCGGKSSANSRAE